MSFCGIFPKLCRETGFFRDLPEAFSGILFGIFSVDLPKAPGRSALPGFLFHARAGGTLPRPWRGWEGAARARGGAARSGGSASSKLCAHPPPPAALPLTFVAGGLAARARGRASAMAEVRASRCGADWRNGPLRRKRWRAAGRPGNPLFTAAGRCSVARSPKPQLAAAGTGDVGRELFSSL